MEDNETDLSAKNVGNSGSNNDVQNQAIHWCLRRRMKSKNYSRTSKNLVKLDVDWNTIIIRFSTNLVAKLAEMKMSKIRQLESTKIAEDLF